MLSVQTVERVQKQAATFEISVVVPVYNSSDTLNPLFERLTTTLTDCSERFELIFVNDCSTDRSWEKLLSFLDRGYDVQLVNMMRNYGQHNALLCGIRKARYQTIVTLDDDLQNPPEEITKLLDRLDAGADVVYGVPIKAEQSAWRSFCSQLTKKLMNKLLGASFARSISSFRAFRKTLVGSFSRWSSPQVNIDVLLSWGSNRFDAAMVEHSPRNFGKSNYNIARLITHAINMITGFSVLPLRFAGFIGMMGVLCGFFLLAYVVGRFCLQGSPVPGFPFLASIVILFSGAQLMALGIIGEYLARMYLRTMEQPAYAIREELRSDSSELAAAVSESPAGR